MTDNENDELHPDAKFVRNDLETRIDRTIEPRLSDLEAESDDAREERVELLDAVQNLQQEVAVMKERIDGMTGLAKDQESSPDKRLLDLRQAMIRRAEAREDRGETPGVKMHYRDVQELFADLGHGEVKKPLCYKAMRKARDAPGFEETTKHRDGRQIEATRLNLEALRALVGSNNVTTAEEVRPDGIVQGVVSTTTGDD